MYFPSGAPDTKAIEALTLHPLEIPGDKAEIRPAYTNYLAAKDRLNAVLAAWKQGPDGGIRLAAQVRAHYPKVPIAFYSRKATAEDVLRCLRQDGVLDVISKPTGRDDMDTERRTQGMKADLVLRFTALMDSTKVQHKSDLQQAVRLVLEEAGFFSTIRP
jgi:CheY-like chemotaxis protein